MFDFRKIIALTATGVDHHEVEGRVRTSGEIGGGYLMMTAISAAIAVLGLLLSSPAVVIGAMLLSPLMGPIVLLGFSFWTVDWASTRKAVISLAAGFSIALLVSIALTVFSPLKEPTAEILARSRPTLFDLLVAIFSGVAGGYAVVRHRGEAVIGVAIATALMPPLAVVGFGIGTQTWSIAGGALLLFFTNLIAIALAAAVVAAFSGFRPSVHMGERGWIRHAAVGAILVVLCVPLTVSLRSIALEGRANAAARGDVSKLFGPKSRIASLTIRADRNTVRVSGLVATPHYIDHASDRLAKAMQARLHTPVDVNLDQVVLADPRKLKPVPAGPPGDQTAPDPTAPALASLRAAVPFADATVLYDKTAGTGVVILAPDSGLDLAGARALETGLRNRPGEDDAMVIPPVQALAPIPISVSRKAGLTLGAYDQQRWALLRWRAPDIRATLCRGGLRGVRTGVLQKALEQAFAPLPVSLSSSRAACAGAALKPPFVVVAPGPAG